MDYYEAHPEPFIARVQSTPWLQVLPLLGAEINLFFHSEVHNSVLTSVRMELAELSKRIVWILKNLKKSQSPSLTIIPPFCPPRVERLKDICSLRNSLSLALFSVTIPLISLRIGFTLIRCQWQHFIPHPQRFFHATQARFLDNVDKLAEDETQATTAFLYLSGDELSDLSKIVKEVLARQKVATCPTNNISKEKPLLYPDVAQTCPTRNA